MNNPDDLPLPRRHCQCFDIAIMLPSYCYQKQVLLSHRLPGQFSFPNRAWHELQLRENRNRSAQCILRRDWEQ